MTDPSALDPEENLPEWLRSMRERHEDEEPQGADDAQQDPAAAEGSEDEPQWLRDIRQRYQRENPEAAEQANSEPEAPEQGDTQPIVPAALSAEEQVAPESVEPEEDGEPEEEIEEPLDEQATQAFIPEEPQEADEPEFSQEAESQLSSLPAFFGDDSEPISPGELPGWLEALRPRGAFPEADERSGDMLPGRSVGDGPLAGLNDVLPAEPEVARHIKPPVFSSRLDVTENQRLHANAFRSLLDAEDQSKGDPRQSTALPTRLLNLLMSAVLLAAVLFPLYTGSRSVKAPDPTYSPEATEIFNTIEVLPAGAPVLVAFEMQPALYGETAPVAAAVIGHLLDRQARLVFMSTLPTGPALAEDLLQGHFAALPAIATGDYTNLGYLSGGMAALRSFLNDPQGTVTSLSAFENPWSAPALQPLQSVSDFAMVLVVSGSAEDVRMWIEQGAGELPAGLVAVTSAQANPLLRSYLQSEPATLQGLVSGQQGAALYETLRAELGDGRRTWDAYSYGLGAIVLLILLGGLYGRLIQTNPEAGEPYAV